MKPTSPEEREFEKLDSEVSESYRAAAADEPSTRLDAAILAAARREVQQQPLQQRHWQVPASIAAALVIGVSLVLVVRDNEPRLPSLERPVADEAKLAKPSSPQLAMKPQMKAKADSVREDRPGRERSVRPDRESIARNEAVQAPESAVTSAPKPAAAMSPAPVRPAMQDNSRIAESGADSLSKKTGSLGAVESTSRESGKARSKEEGSVTNRQHDWLGKIDALLQEGKQAEARRQLADFRRQYPDYPLAERFQALLTPDQR